MSHSLTFFDRIRYSYFFVHDLNSCIKLFDYLNHLFFVNRSFLLKLHGRNYFLLNQFIVYPSRIFYQTDTIFFYSFFPYKAEFVGIGFYLCSVYENSFIVYYLFFYKLGSELNKTLTKQFLHFFVASKSVNSAIAG